MQDSEIPSLFLAHGSPVLAIENDAYSDFLARLGKQYQPKAIIIFTAHWETEVLTISSRDDVYETIYDWTSKFPQELHEVVYRAKGSTKTASMIQERLNSKGIPVEIDSTRGLDHGSWTLLHRVYPEANIPVVQISISQNLSPKEQFKIGDALKGLGKEGFMVIGSGVTCHNDVLINKAAEKADEWAS